MNKFLSSISSGGVTKEEVLQIIEETSVVYNDDSSVSINNSANASIYTLPTVGGVAGNSVVVGADGKHLIFANTGGGGGGVQNPMSVDLDAGAFNINNVESLTSNYIDTDNITPKTGSSILVNGDLNLNSNGLTRVDKITCLTTATPSVDLKLDLIPSSQGTAGQVLSRSPLFDPANSSTYKLVWQTIAGGGGGVQNPMSVDLDAGGFNINNIESLTSNYIDTDNITPKTGSSILVNGDLNLNSNGLTRVDRITCFSTATPNVDLKLDLVPLSQGTANQVLARSPLFDAGNSSTWKLVWQTPVSGGITNPLTANIQSAQYSMFDMNTLECKNVNIMTSGGGLSSMNGALQVPITWGLALKLSADPFYRTFNTDYITPATGAGVTIDSKLQDGKTDSKITLSSPSIIINNSTNPTPSAIQINGNIQLTNTAGYIQGDSIILRGRTSGGSSTPLYVESSITYMSNKLFVLTDRSPSIGVRTTLFKTFGAMPNVNINTLTPIKLNSIIANQKGDNFIPPNGFVNGDKFIIIMNGILTTVGSGSLNIYLYVGAVQALAFNITNVASSAQPCKITMEVDCTVAGNNVNLSNGTALLSFERFNTAIRYSTITASTLVDNTVFSNSIDIYVSQSATQISNFTPISYTIEQL